MPDVGDTAALTLTVDPFDGTTAATVAVTSPVGVESTPTASTSDDGATWTANLLLTVAGAWQVVWTVTGQGAGVQRDTVYAIAGGDPAEGESYATLSELAAYLGDVPQDGAAKLLVRASRRIDSTLIGAVYDVDDDGLPTDTDVAAALRDATCAQVEWWDEVGDTTGTGAGGDWSGVSIGKVSLSTGTSGGNRADPPSKRRISPGAIEILQVAGLLPISAWMRG